MNEQEFEAGHGDALKTMRTARGECPSADDLLDWVEGTLTGQRTEAIERHLSLCSHCADVADRARQPDPQFDDVHWQRTARSLDARGAAWKPTLPGLRPAWLSLAAAVVAAVALTIVFLPQDQPPPAGEIAVTRSADIVLLTPRGRVQSVESFRWRGIPAPVQYRVEVSAFDAAPDSEPLWTGVTPETRLLVDSTQLAVVAKQHPLRWRVVILDGEGYVLGQSDWAQFEVLGSE